MTNDNRHTDALKATVATLRQVQLAECSADLYGRLDTIMYSLEEIIYELQPDHEDDDE
jgi:hypothetical protein